MGLNLKTLDAPPGIPTGMSVDRGCSADGSAEGLRTGEPLCFNNQSELAANLENHVANDVHGSYSAISGWSDGGQSP